MNKLIDDTSDCLFMNVAPDPVSPFFLGLHTTHCVHGLLPANCRCCRRDDNWPPLFRVDPEGGVLLVDPGSGVLPVLHSVALPDHAGGSRAVPSAETRGAAVNEVATSLAIQNCGGRIWLHVLDPGHQPHPRVEIFCCRCGLTYPSHAVDCPALESPRENTEHLVGVVDSSKFKPGDPPMSWTLNISGKCADVRQDLPVHAVSSSAIEDELRESAVGLVLASLEKTDLGAYVHITCSGEEFKRVPDGALAYSLHVNVHAHLPFAPAIPDTRRPLTPEGQEVPE